MNRNKFSAIFAMLALAVCTTTLHATPASPLLPTYTPTGTPVQLTYTLPSTAGSNVAVSLATAAVAAAPASNTFFTIDPTTVPIWLSVDVMSGTVVSPITAGAVAGTPVVVHLVASSVAGSLGPGVYNATVQADVIGFLPLNISVSLKIVASAPTLTFTGDTALGTETWAIGGTQAPFTFSIASNGDPIPFTTTLSSLTSTGTTVANGITLTPLSGLAYTWGTTLTVTLSPLVYAEAKAGDVLSATITLNTPTASVSSTPITFQLTVTPPVATITSLYPSAVPVDSTATDVVNLVISGSGFVPSGTGQITEVFLAGSQVVTGTGMVVNVINSTTITLAITIGTNTYFAAAGTPLAIAVVNPNGGSPAAPTSGAGFANLPVVSTPIIDSISSASTFIQNGASSQFAPYDMITIFGNQLCPDCGGSNPSLLVGTPDPTFQRYPTSLTPDSTHYLQVQFNKHGGALVAQGYLIFANNNQINVLVPAALATVTPSLIGTGTVDVTVSYGITAPPTAPLAAETSSAYTVGVIANDPGVLTANSNGSGQGAILNSDFSLNSSSNAALHTTGSVLVYMTGLGAPNSTSSNATTTTALAYPGSCISALGVAGSSGPPVVAAILGYMNAINSLGAPPSPLWTSVDGAVIQSALIVGSGTSHYPPCNSGVTATINGVTATVTYAGWVANSVAGLYQVNLTVPAGAVPGTYPSTGGTPVSVPVVVTIGGKSSQSGVTLWAK